MRLLLVVLVGEVNLHDEIRISPEEKERFFKAPRADPAGGNS